MHDQPVLNLRMDKIQQLCDANGIASLRDLSARIGVSPSTLWRVDQGIAKPSPGLIARIKLAFPMVSFDDLIEVAA